MLPIIKTEKPINQWARLNKVLVAYRFALLVMSGVVLGFFVLTVILVNKDTIVIGMANNENLLFLGERKDVSISETDVEKTARLFINTRYSWNKSNSESLIKDLSPITSSGLLKKIEETFNKNKAAVAQNGLAQDVIIRDIKLDDGKVFAQIDRVIQLAEKMKVVSPMDITITLIRGQSNRWNATGLYVNSVIEHEGE